MPLRHVRPFAAACTLALAACQPHEPVATYTTEEFREPCVSYYTDSDEVASRGTLVQLDVTLRYRTTNTFSTGSGNGATQVEAEAVVEASSSQLACRWDRDGGAAYYEVRRDAVDGAKPFPGRANGTARLSGFNETRADGVIVREEADISGPVEHMAVGSITNRDGSDVPICVGLEFDAPMRGQARMVYTGGGLRKEEPIQPGSIVSDSYSAIATRSYGDGIHRFRSQSLTVCTGKEETGLAVGVEPAAGLVIGADDRLWQRSGPWGRHMSGPREKRTVDFSMRIVEPQLPFE